jgi:hypothetical protein
MAIQYTVIEEDGTLPLSRKWFQNYGQGMITAEVEMGGFILESLWRT